MIIAKPCFLDSINALTRHIKGRVELYEGSTLLNTFLPTDTLKSFTVDRTIDGSKLFGYGICQKLQVKLRDKDRTISIARGNGLEAVFGTGCDYIYSYPIFYVQDVNRNENTNELTVTAYDALYTTANVTFSDLNLIAPYTIAEVATACACTMKLPWQMQNVDDGSFDTIYEAGANFSGQESVRQVLDAIAEATQTIYFIDHDWRLTFKRLDVHGDPVVTIDKSKYFSLDNKDVYTLSAIGHATDLGDNVIAGTSTGVVQYIKNNPFWDLRTDITSLINRALAAVKGLTFTQFNCSWRGNYLLELGDKIALVGKDNSVIETYLLDDVITYNGAMHEQSEFTFDKTEGESPSSTPSTLGGAVNQTTARVDKVNKRIDLVIMDMTEQGEKISSLNMTADEIQAEVQRVEDETLTAIGTLSITTDAINASVERVEQIATDNFDSVTNDIATLTSRVESTVSPEYVTIAIQQELANGVDKVTTTTGFTFNEDGLTVSKTGSEMTTQITEDGMSVYRDGSEVLTVDNTGVKAENLHATTYLIVGQTSRFEDYGNRTGCFWIGG